MIAINSNPLVMGKGNQIHSSSTSSKRVCRREENNITIGVIVDEHNPKVHTYITTAIELAKSSFFINVGYCRSLSFQEGFPQHDSDNILLLLLHNNEQGNVLLGFQEYTCLFVFDILRFYATVYHILPWSETKLA